MNKLRFFVCWTVFCAILASCAVTPSDPGWEDTPFGRMGTPGSYPGGNSGGSPGWNVEFPYEVETWFRDDVIMMFVEDEWIKGSWNVDQYANTEYAFEIWVRVKGVSTCQLKESSEFPGVTVFPKLKQRIFDVSSGYAVFTYSWDKEDIGIHMYGFTCRFVDGTEMVTRERGVIVMEEPVGHGPTGGHRIGLTIGSEKGPIEVSGDYVGDPIQIEQIAGKSYEITFNVQQGLRCFVRGLPNLQPPPPFQIDGNLTKSHVFNSDQVGFWNLYVRCIFGDAQWARSAWGIGILVKSQQPTEIPMTPLVPGTLTPKTMEISSVFETDPKYVPNAQIAGKGYDWSFKVAGYRTCSLMGLPGYESSYELDVKDVPEVQEFKLTGLMWPDKPETTGPHTVTLQCNAGFQSDTKNIELTVVR